MTNKEYLSQYLNLWREIEIKLEELKILRSRAEKVTAALSDMPRGGTGSDFTTAADMLLELQLKIDSDVLRAAEKRSEIEQAINALENSTYKRILWRVYINGTKLVDLAEAENYSYHHFCVLHGEALSAIIQRP